MLNSLIIYTLIPRYKKKKKIVKKLCTQYFSLVNAFRCVPQRIGCSDKRFVCSDKRVGRKRTKAQCLEKQLLKGLFCRDIDQE